MKTLIAVLAGALALPLDAAVGQIYCPGHVTIMGGSNPSDQTKYRCKLDNNPALLTGVEMLAAPVYARQVESSITVVVDSSGRVIPRLTRFLSRDSADHFHANAMRTITGFRYGVGLLKGDPTRYGFALHIRTGMRADTVPQALVWRYVRGSVDDSLVGTWRPVVPEPPLTRSATVHVARSITHKLREMDVLASHAARPYCVIADGPHAESVRKAVHDELHGSAMADQLAITRGSCASDITRRRYRIGSPVRTGGGRIVVNVSGDVLRRWPLDLNGRMHATWQAYCVAPAADPVGCEITPVKTGDSAVDAVARSMFPSDEDPTGPISLAMEVTTRGAYRIDTVRAVIDEIPSLGERAVFRKAVFCTGSAIWTAIADRPINNEMVVMLTFPRRGVYPFTDVTEVRPPSGPFRGFGCDDDEEDVGGDVALFTLRGIGNPIQGPVQFCLNMHGCASDLIIEPGRHELAAAPHLRFKLADLRPVTAQGKTVDFRVHLDRDIEGLAGFVLIRGPAKRISSWPMRRRNAREIDFNVGGVTATPETEFLIYLAKLPVD
jgi:hypothetical protein